MSPDRDCLRRKIGLQAPVIGRMMRRSELFRCARKAAEGDASAVLELCKALDSGDREAASLAREALSALPAAGQEVCCSMVITRENRLLADLCREMGYTPRDSQSRVLFYLLSGQYGAFSSSDNAAGLLVQAYREAPWSRRVRIIRALTAWGRPELLAGGADAPGVPGRAVPVAAWDLIARRLIAQGDYETCSQLLFSAPLSAAYSITCALKAVGFIPPDGDPGFWRRLYAAVPEGFRYPEPADDIRAIFPGGAVQYSRAVIDPTGRFLAAGCYDGTIEILKIPSGDLVCTHPSGAGSILAAGWSADGRRVAFGGSRGMLCVVELPGGQLAGRYDIGSSAVTVLSFTPDSRCMVCGGRDGGITLVRLPDGRRLQFSGRPSTEVTGIVATGSGMIFSGHEDGTVWSWSDRGCRGSRLEPDHPGPVLFLSSVPEGLLVTGSAQGPLMIRDTGSGRPVRTAGCPEMTATAFATSGKWVAAGDADGTVVVYTIPDGREICSYRVHRSGVSALCASPDGSWCAAGSRSGTVHVLPVPGPGTPIFFTGRTGGIRHLSAAVPGTVCSSGWNGTLEVRRSDDGTLLLCTEGQSSSVTCISAAAGSGLLAVAGSGSVIHLWDLPAREYRGMVETYTPGITTLVLLSSGSRAAVAGSDGSLILIRLPDGTVIRSLRGHTGSISALASDPSSARLAAGGWDAVVYLHDLEHDKPPVIFRGHASPVTSVSFSPQGNLLASTSQDRTARIWDVTAGTSGAVLSGHRRVVSASAFSPDGTILATGSWDHTIRLWSVPDGEAIAVLNGHRDRISRLVFAGSGMLASGDESGLLGLWTIPDGELIQFRESRAGRVTGLLPVRDDRELLSAHDQGLCIFRDLPWTKIPEECSPDDYARVREYLADAAGADNVHIQPWQWIEALLAGDLRKAVALCPDPPLAGGYEIELAGD
jgi:WD40 repeat protein